MTYQQMISLSGKLIVHMQGIGIGHGDRVAIALPTNMEFIVSILSVMRLGAVYIPLLAYQSPVRTQAILQDAEAAAVLCSGNFSENSVSFPGPCINVASVFANDSADTPIVAETTTATLQDPAYIIYTSGSTGRPKGVVIPHLGLLDYCQYALSGYYTDLNGAIVSTQPAFDITVPALFLPLLAGGQVVLPGTAEPLEHLAKQLRSNDGKKWLLRLTPLHVQGLIELLGKFTADQDKHVFVVGGDVLTLDVAHNLQSLFPGSRIYNHYGPSETVVGCTIFDVTANLDQLTDVVPIGQPMANTQVYVLDEHQRPVPEGAVGELVIGSNGMALHYSNLPELTQQKFIKNPFPSGSKTVYRTGDMVKWGPAQQLIYLGRQDNQVKVRGFRVELGEINQVLCDVEQIASAYTLTLGDESDQSKFVSYLIANVNSGLTEEQLIREAGAQCKRFLPYYAQPYFFVVLHAFPMTENGKVDRTRLPEPEVVVSDKQFVAPQSDTEKTLAQIWESLLKKPADNISVNANFFEMGGHSLLAIRLVSQVKEQFGLAHLEFNVKEIFDCSTLADLAARIDLFVVKQRHFDAKYTISKAQEMEEGEF